MKLKTGLSLFIAGATLSIAIVSCKKDAKTTTPIATVDTDTSTESDNNLADAAFNDVQNISDQAYKGNLTFYSPIYTGGKETATNVGLEKSSCASITRDSVIVSGNVASGNIVVDFGTVNCLCNDGRNRRGKINISYTGRYRDSASVRTITFTDYYIDDNQLTGTKIVTNKGHNANGHLNYDISVNGSVIKANNGGTHTHIANRNREWISGESTLVVSDDVYSITGSTSGVNAAGVAYTANITTALHRAVSCSWIDSGVVEVTRTGKPTRTLDYGNGTCDHDATVTINGTSRAITLH